MKIKFACPDCGRPHAVDASLAGKSGRCKGCGVVMRVPDAPRAPVASGSRSRATTAGSTVHDPYGLDEGPASPSPELPPRRESFAEEEAAPLRVRPRTGRSKGRRGEPWNLPLRSLAVRTTGLWVAIGVTGLILLVQPLEPLKPIGIGVLLLGGLIGIAAQFLAWVSLIGSFVSLIRGNGRAFSGESFGGQVAWALTVLIGTGGGVVLLAALPTAIQSARNAAARRDGQVADPVFPGVPGMPGGPGFAPPPGAVVTRTTGAEAEAAVWMIRPEMYFDRMVNNKRQVAGLFEREFSANFPGYFGYFMGLPGLDREWKNTLLEFEYVSLPNPAQAKTLREKFHEPLLQSYRHVIRALQAAERSIRSGPETPTRQAAIDDVLAWEAEAKAQADRLEAAGPDDLEWYRTAATPRAGARAGQFPDIPWPTREEQAAWDERIRILESAMRRMIFEPSR
jgi:hypothetical protein